MVVRREKKSRAYRGSRTHGWGRVGQHRKSGSRGGRGLVGYHKHKWSWTVKYAPDWYGKHGFTRHPSLVVEYRTINVGQLDAEVEEFFRKGLASREGDAYVVDLTQLGFNKLTGSGQVRNKIIVKVPVATKRAISKIEAQGGRVEVAKTQEAGE
ncbi:uL15 family ribosomal protein [Thermofilum pendens]|uniref:uL15 family ribosomal protein n=1 Tax=Thermofilum pendens TaxID=2269 RepID=UPI00069968AB